MKAPAIVELPTALSALLRDPAVPGAACREQPGDHDPAGYREPEHELAARHTRALQRCRTCPALGRCRAALDDLRDHLPGFVMAGEILRSTS